jgi:transposase
MRASSPSSRGQLLTVVRPPTEDEEAVRDLCRGRDDARLDLMRARHGLSKFLLRRGRVFGTGEQRAWSQAHRWWLGTQTLERTAEQVMFEDYLLAVEQAEARKRSLELHLEDSSREPRYAEAVGCLRCFRGIDTVTAITLIAELHVFRRFHSPRALMAYLGLVPSEYSSGPSEQRGGITRTGNRHVRCLLIEAAWHYRYKPRVGDELAARRHGQPAHIITLADKAQARLCRRYRRMERRGKHTTKIVVAVARELVGYVWAALTPTGQAVKSQEGTAGDGRAISITGKPAIPLRAPEARFCHARSQTAVAPDEARSCGSARQRATRGYQSDTPSVRTTRPSPLVLTNKATTLLRRWSPGEAYRP